MQEFDKALFDINKAVELDPQNPQLYLLRGMIYGQKRLNDNAIADFRKVLELSQDEDLRAQATDLLQQLGVSVTPVAP